MHKRDQTHFLKCLVSTKSSTASLLQEEWLSLHVFGDGRCHFVGNRQGNRISLGSTRLFLSRYLIVVVPPLSPPSQSPHQHHLQSKTPCPVDPHNTLQAAP